MAFGPAKSESLAIITNKEHSMAWITGGGTKVALFNPHGSIVVLVFVFVFVDRNDETRTEVTVVVLCVFLLVGRKTGGGLWRMNDGHMESIRLESELSPLYFTPKILSPPLLV